jgi:hypothetical protein
MDLKDLKYSAGVGISIGMTKVPGSDVLRVDVGWSLNAEGGAQLTLGTSQHFSTFKK